MASDFELLVDMIHEQLADPTVGKYVFRVSQPEHAQLRRIVWIPRDYSSAPAKRTNPLREKDGRVAKVLGQEEWSVEAHITAESFAALEDLRRRLLYVLDEAFGTDCVPHGGAWTTQDEDIAGVMWAGAEKCVMHFTWMFNVVTFATPVVVKQVETTPTIEETPEPPFVQP